MASYLGGRHGGDRLPLGQRQAAAAAREQLQERTAGHEIALREARDDATRQG